MSSSEYMLVVMSTLVTGFAIATIGADFLPAIRESWSKARFLNQSGDSSLSRHSVNWLGGLALAGAVLLGVVLV